MNPIEFKEMNRILRKPESMTDEECGSLPVFTNGIECISCWKLTDEELNIIKKTKKIYLSVISGSIQPPVCLDVNYPFKENKNEKI